jgi:hypothetical protein
MVLPRKSEFRQGAAGYGRYYWHTYADYADENLWVEFILPVALHQDSRYCTLGTGGFSKRLAYSFSRIAITRNDSGHESFNASEVLGAGAAAAISGRYYPGSERTLLRTTSAGLQVSRSTVERSSSKSSGPTSTANSSIRKIETKLEVHAHYPPSYR